MQSKAEGLAKGTRRVCVVVLLAVAVLASGLAAAGQASAAQGGSAFISVKASAVTTNQYVGIQFGGIAKPTDTDWVGSYRPGAPDTSYLDWTYTKGLQSGTLGWTFKDPGTYELRLFAANDYRLLAKSNLVTVTARDVAKLTASPTFLQAGGTVTIKYANVSKPTTDDWIGVYTVGAADNEYTAWMNTHGGRDGSVTVPIKLPGKYEFRLFRNRGWTKIATSNPVTVVRATATPAATVRPSISAPPSARPGERFVVRWAGIGRPTATDWVGMYVAGAANGDQIAHVYTNGTSSGSRVARLPNPGVYEFRLFSNNTHTLLATSNRVVIG